LPAFEGPLDLLLHLIEREDSRHHRGIGAGGREQYLAQLRSAGDHQHERAASTS
jgi:hypothetical protein